MKGIDSFYGVETLGVYIWGSFMYDVLHKELPCI